MKFYFFLLALSGTLSFIHDIFEYRFWHYFTVNFHRCGCSSNCVINYSQQIIWAICDETVRISFCLQAQLQPSETELWKIFKKWFYLYQPKTLKLNPLPRRLKLVEVSLEWGMFFFLVSEEIWFQCTINYFFSATKNTFFHCIHETVFEILMFHQTSGFVVVNFFTHFHSFSAIFTPWCYENLYFISKLFESEFLISRRVAQKHSKSRWNK